MKRCPRCNSHTREVVREATVRRGNREYVMQWFRCGTCQEVSLSYRLVNVEPASLTSILGESEPSRLGEASPTDTPVLSR